MSRCCDKCGQPLPAEVRRDPPLPPLDHPAVVTIHDLPAGIQFRAVTASEPGRLGVSHVFEPVDAVDAREGRG